MQSLEIRDPELFLHMFQDVAVSARTIPSIIMLAATSKLVVFFVINIAVFVIVLKAGWLVAVGDDHQQILYRKDFNGLARSNPGFNYGDETQQQDSQTSEMISQESRI